MTLIAWLKTPQGASSEAGLGTSHALDAPGAESIVPAEAQRIKAAVYQRHFSLD